MDDSRDLKLEKQIDAYLKGNLSDEAVDELWGQLIQKPEYISLLETEIDLKRFYREKQKTNTLNHFWKWVAALAAVAALVLSIHYFGEEWNSGVDELMQGKIDLAENLSSAPVMRSAQQISAPDSMLNMGFKAAIDGDLVKAQEVYQDIFQQVDNPQILSKAYLNTGILQYNAENYEASIKSFNRAIAMAAREDSLLTERSYWFLGNAFIHVDQLKPARAAIQQANNLGNLFKDESEKLLQWLDQKKSGSDLKRKLQENE